MADLSADTIKAARLRLGLTQAQFADADRLLRAGGLLLGTRNPDADRAVRQSRA